MVILTDEPEYLWMTEIQMDSYQYQCIAVGAYLLVLMEAYCHWYWIAIGSCGFCGYQWIAWRPMDV